MIKSASTMQPAVGSFSSPEAERKFRFREAIENNRDQWGRPKIMLPDGSRETGYRRASSYGAPLEDESNLTKWKQRQVARGIARRSDLALAVTRAEVGLDRTPGEAKKAKTDLNDLCDQAMDVVESGAKASIGTSLHDVFEAVDLGQDPGHLPELWRPDLAAYRKLMTGFRVLSSELFVVQDDHRVAGTLDRAVELLIPMTAPDGTVLEPGTVVIGDVKTAQKMDFAGCKFGVQCFVYATGTPYDPIAKTRTPWEHEPPNQSWALIFHVGSGTGQAGLYWVDLLAAAEAAERAREVYEWRNSRGKALIRRGTTAEDFTVTCEVARTEFDLLAAYQRAVAAGEWTEILKARFSKRKAELAAATNGEAVSQ